MRHSERYNPLRSIIDWNSFRSLHSLHSFNQFLYACGMKLFESYYNSSVAERNWTYWTKINLFIEVKEVK